MRVHLSQCFSRVGEQTTHGKDLSVQPCDGRAFGRQVFVHTAVNFVRDGRFDVFAFCGEQFKLLAAARQFVRFSDCAPLAREQCRGERNKPLEVVFHAERNGLAPRHFFIERVVRVHLSLSRC